LGERTGKDYEFITLKEFDLLRKREEFLEWAEIFGQYYGTRRSPVEQALKKGQKVVLAIDIQGARGVRQALKGKAPLFSIFVLPPSIQALRDRLTGRKTDSPEEIEKRIDRAQEEIKAAREYDSTVVNLDLEETVRDIEARIDAFEKKLKGGT
jgi:guanylate kinase